MQARAITEIDPTASSAFVLGTRVDVLDYDRASRRIMNWARQQQARFICAANVHVVMEGHDARAYQEMVNGADMVTSDGMPLVWMLRAQGFDASRVYGPDLMRILLEVCEREKMPVGLYGGSPAVLDRLLASIQREHPNLPVAYACSPPFRELSQVEDAQIITDIQESGARMLFVGLGCPRQERWITRHLSTIHVPMLGVGAAFDFIAGTKRTAPALLQRMGLEWLFRLMSEPGRLWRRYVVHNPRFLVLAGLQLTGFKHVIS
ncbi:MAG: WecB/TagA/CpsF family glycosyltransferase [Bryobacteraceae bacterium]